MDLCEGPLTSLLHLTSCSAAYDTDATLRRLSLPVVEVEIESLFRPSSASVRQLLSDMVGGFAIPAYQRPYRWKPADIRRLYESVMIGLERLKDDPKGVSFIGAV